MKEQNNKNTDKKIVTLKKSNTSNSYNSRIRIKFKPNNKYKSRHYKSKRIRIRHPWYNKKRQLTTLPSTIIYDAFNKNLSFHNPATPSLPIQPPIEKYSIDRLLSMGYPLLRARELT